MGNTEKTASSAFTRRGFIAGGLATGTLSLLAACSAGNASSGVVSAGAGKSLKGLNLDWWSRDSFANGAMEPAVRAALAAFDQKNGTSTVVQFMDLPTSSQKELAALTGGGLPTLGEQGQDVTMLFAEGGNLQSLDSIYSGLKTKLTQLPKAAVTQHNGHVYGLPWWLETRVLWYHKDLFQQAGIEPPTTWDEWLNATKALTKGTEQYGLAVPAQGALIGQLFAPLAASAGGTMLDSNGNLDTTPDAFVEALQFMEKLNKAGMPPAAITYTGPVTQQLFLAKKTAMTWDNGGVLQLITSTKPQLLDTVGAIVTPKIKTGGLGYSFLGGFELFAFNKGQTSSGARSLIDFLYGDPTNYEKIMNASGGLTIPILAEAANGKMWQSGPRKVLVDQLKDACRYAGPAYGTRGYMGQAEANGVFSNPVADVFSGKSSPQAAVQAMFSQLKTLAAG